MAEVGETILSRRSARNFTGEAIPRRMIEDILSHAVWAPSPKNGQPWLLRVLGQTQCRELCELASTELNDRLASNADSRSELIMAKATVSAMEAAAAACFVVLDADYSGREASSQIWDIGATDCEVADLLSLGMLAQNALLRAHELGIGSLCICDHFCFYETVSEFLGERRPVVLGLLFGIAQESIAAGGGLRRKPLGDVSEWNWGS